MANERDLIDFVSLKAALLDRAETLVPQWLPGGKKVGKNWMCAGFSGGEGRSLGVHLENGRWGEFADGEAGGDLISLYAAIHGLASQIEAAREIMRNLGWERSSSVQAPAQRDGGRRPPPTEKSHAPPAGAGDGRARKSIWRAVVPVPEHAPQAEFHHFQRSPDDIEGTWEYRFEGQLYGYAVRFKTSDGGKDILVRTWCVDESDDRGTQRWHWKQWEEPRPLYVPATLLSGDPANIPVVLVEGEKCADVGFGLLPAEFDFASWPGGCNAWEKAAWGWLMGRTVYLWADCDSKREKLTKQEEAAGVDPATKPLRDDHKQPGVRAMTQIGSLLAADYGCTVYWIPIPKAGSKPDGWDIADAVAEGWGPNEVRSFIRSATAFMPPDAAARAKAAPVIAPAGAGPVVDSDAWRAKLILTDKGGIKACRENIVLALDGMRLSSGSWLPGVPAAAGVIGYNEFTNNVEMRREPPWVGKAGKWGEETELEMGDWLARELWLPPMSRQTLEEAVIMVGRRHAYHPLRERFEALRGKWDGTQRLPSWLERSCLGGEPMPKEHPLRRYLARVGTWFVMAMVKRILEPGCKFDYMVVFEGGQGRGKSTLARVLSCGYFADTGLVLGDKDSYQNLQGKSVYEWAELDALARADVRKVKSFISSETDYFRASFDRRPRDYPRQVVFIGTTNESHYLSDPTGNRRFWPVRVTRKIDLEWVRANLEQMLAEAVHRVDANERMYPTEKEQDELFGPQQNDRTIDSSLDAAIREYLYDEHQRVPMNGANGALLERIALKDLLAAVGLPLEKQTSLVTKEASAVLGRLGWQRDSRASSKVDAKRPWLYHRPSSLSNDVPGGSSGSADRPNSPPQGFDSTEAADACPF